MGNVITVTGLTREFTQTKGWIRKRRSTVRAIDDISFDIKKGEVFGLLGPNGAGKTTTIKILTTLLAPTKGEARILGYKSFGEEKNIRPHINFVFGGEAGVYRRLTGRENLLYFADLYRINGRKSKEKAEELLELVGLTNKADFKVETYSKGMIQRLQIARGLLNDPEIMFFDEPTIGLDPKGARDLRAIIKMLSNNGKTILLTTHYMYEADELCHRAAFIDKGKVIALDTPENLKRDSRGMYILEVKILGDIKGQCDQVRNIQQVKELHTETKNNESTLTIQCADIPAVFTQVVDIFKKKKILAVSSREATLEDAYIKLLGGSV